MGLEGIGLTVRLLAILYFLTQVVRHARYQGDKRDLYTVLTFLFLGLSLMCFFVFRVCKILESTLKLFDNNDDVVRQWFLDNATFFTVLKGVLMPGLAYFLQSLAFFVNIQRWKVVLGGGQTLSFHVRSQIKKNKKQKKRVSFFLDSKTV